MVPNYTADSFAVFGLSHKTAPLELREKLAFKGTELDEFYRQLLSNSGVDGVLILSTCNRSEVYVVGANLENLHKEMEDKFVAKMGSAPKQDVFYWYTGASAITHLIRVTSGLDSMILGETQITNQVKEAYSRAISLGMNGTLMNQIAHRAFRVAKKVRTDTDIQRQPVSVPYTAVLLAEQIFGELSSKRVMLVGAGDMSELAARHLVEHELEGLMIANRSHERAENLAREFLDKVACEVLSLESLGAHLHEADIVIASTSAQETLISADQVREAMRLRRNRAMFFIDLGVPRDIAPEINEVMNAYLFDIDDLQQVVDDNLEERQQAAAEADVLIRAEVGTLNGYLAERDLTPVIRDLVTHYESLGQIEIDKLCRKLPDMDVKEKEAIEQAMRGMMKKALHPTLIWLKEANSTQDQQEKVELLKRLMQQS